MKLYTEKQVKLMIEKSRETGLTAEYLTLTTPAIELPSDEEIVFNACKNPIADDFMNDRQIGFVKGCKWMKEQILNQNK